MADHINVWDRDFGKPYKYKRVGRDDTKIKKRDNLNGHTSRQEQIIRALLENDDNAITFEDAERGVLLELTLDPSYGVDADFFERNKLRVDIKLSTLIPGGLLKLVLLIPKPSIPDFLALWKQFDVDPKATTEKSRRKAIASVEEIKLAIADSLYVGPRDYFPISGATPTWWELWLPPKRVAFAKAAAKRNGLTFRADLAQFADRTICLAHATIEQLYSSGLMGALSEIREPQFSVSFLVNIEASDGKAYQDAGLRRVAVAEARVPVVLIDSGVNAGHPLLQEAEGIREAVAVYQSNTSDQHNHGTGVASTILYGPRLHKIIDGEEHAVIEVLMDSVNAMQVKGAVPDPKLYGPDTVRGCLMLDHRDARIFVSTVSREDPSPTGAPDSYSSSIDLLTYGLDVNTVFPNQLTGFGKVLFVQAAGNVATDEMADAIDAESRRLRSPAQSWNALVVGAYTDLPEYKNAAEVYGSGQGALSAYSTDSLGYTPKRPLLPDVVFEGGNTAIVYGKHGQIDHGSLLCANANFQQHPFAVMWGTSAAAALAARFCAQLQKRYPDYWPETIRALTVHSARWTDPMLALRGTDTKKTATAVLVQRCGFGVPDFELASDSNPTRVTLVREASIQPFVRNGSSINLNELHLVELPWPEAGLRMLAQRAPGAPIELRVTLSYYIEPSPSTRDLLSRYKYESHGLRWRFQKPTETADELLAAVCANADSDAVGDSALEWALGTNARHRGSIHSDCWTGTAADLVRMKHLVIYPVSGWWKTREKAGRANESTRYSLVISLDAPNATVDLYAEIENLVSVSVSS